MSLFGGVPVDPQNPPQSGSQFGGVPVAPDAAQRYAADDAARKQANQAAPWYDQFGTGVKAQAGRTMLGVTELANKLVGKNLIDPEVLAEAQREAGRTDAGTGVAGTVGNLVGDFRNYLPVGKAFQAATEARTLGQAAIQSAKIGAVAGGITGLTEGTEDANSSLLSNLKNAGIGTAAGATVGAALPAVGTAAKAGINAAAGGVDRALALTGSEEAARRVALGNVARALAEQGYAPGEVAGIIDRFKSQGIDGGTLGQMLESPALLAREKNLLQGGGEASRVMAENLKSQPQTIADAILAKVKGTAQPDQTDYLYKQAAELADAPTATGTGTVVGMGQSATQKEIPFTLNAIEQDLAERADELPPTVAKRIQKIVAAAKQGGFAEADTAKQQLDDLYKPNSQTTDQDIVNEVVGGYRKMLNDSLEQAGGDTYKAAKASAVRDMAMRDVSDAVTGAQGMSVKAALNKFFGSMDKQDEFFRKLPDDQKQEWGQYLDDLEKVSGKFGGSDTASNTATGKQMNVESGLGFDANVLNPQSWVDRLSAPISRNVRKAQAELTFNPDADALAARMRNLPGVVTAPAGVVAPAAVTAAKAVTPAATVPVASPPSPTPGLPAVTFPKVEFPSLISDAGAAEVPAQSIPRTDLLQKMARAESANNPNARNPNSSASGLLQFTNGTWADLVARYGKQLGVTLADKNDPRAQLLMGQKNTDENAKFLSKALGQAPTDGELYAAHVLGPAGAAKLLTADPSRQAVTVASRKAVAANRTLFFDGSRPRTAAELTALLSDKVS